jgi:hypothetical protein
MVALLEKMQPITLEEMKNIHLMDRIDSKYVAPVSLLPQLLEFLTPSFKVQTIDDSRVALYCTQYLDTPDLQMFTMHQNGKLNRQKIRIRSYVNSNLSFLEIKSKNNKGRTKKIRIPVPLSHLASINELKEGKAFLSENSLLDSNSLEPVLANQFKRITLVNNQATERVTIDFDLSFFNYKTEEKKDLTHLLVLELKQDGWQRSECRDILERLRIKPVSFSKYCIGTVLTNPDVKYNRFKGKWTLINKLTHKII